MTRPSMLERTSEMPLTFENCKNGKRRMTRLLLLMAFYDR